MTSQQAAQKLTQNPNVNTVANLSPPYPAQIRRIMPQSTIMSIIDRPASCAVRKTIPLSAITLTTSKLKY
jgi:hypothetical protein